MKNYLALPLLLALCSPVLAQQECVTVEPFAKAIQEEMPELKSAEMVVLDGEVGTKVLTNLGVKVKGKPLEGVTNVLVYPEFRRHEEGMTVMFIFIKGCFVGQVSGPTADYDKAKAN